MLFLGGTEDSLACACVLVFLFCSVLKLNDCLIDHPGNPIHPEYTLNGMVLLNSFIAVFRVVGAYQQKLLHMMSCLQQRGLMIIGQLLVPQNLHIVAIVPSLLYRRTRMTLL